uniref:Rhodanese domain-containing protein n=1 Tax=Chromera velia CCMP2878 TaxID=1169474 RepID=A0A0G4FEI9_9ALVE|eukprot:Cvel_16619.t1-p1 / transcript=Cvel_16619.t1 / gene=Cvel_16619 / organism=Chromera_velia_CCMP2878 / gene_product=hypothetical protein / transcript_product=hypothetical protein / location=Cvel_scaffold1288:5402-5917(-) / protein_length=172 / sequence_SO=supercontig / SO=protein_coding / is_pseudo=false
MQTQAPGAVAVAQQLQKAGLLLLDTRPWEIFRYSSLPGSINIPVERASHILYRLPTDKKTPLLVYGGDGGSSSAFDASKVCEGLEALGFVDVVNGGSVEFVERLHQSRFESVTVDRGYPRAVRGDGSGRSQRGQLQKSSGSSKSPKGSEDFLNALSGVLAGALEEGQVGGLF